MIVQVRQTDRNGGRLAIEGDLEFELDAQYTLLGKAKFQGECRDLGESAFLIEGTLTLDAQTHCALCTKPTTVQLSIPFSERFERELETGEQEREHYGYSGNEINLSLSLQEAALMALPLRSLCRPDCKGLCPQCGADQNEEACDCLLADDNPFSILKQLDLPEEV